MKISKRETDAIVREILKRIDADDRWYMDRGSRRNLRSWIRAAIKQLDKRGKGSRSTN